MLRKLLFSYYAWKIRGHGRADAMATPPRPIRDSQNLADAEGKVRDDYEKEINRVAKGWKLRDESLHREYCRARRVLLQARIRRADAEAKLKPVASTLHDVQAKHASLHLMPRWYWWVMATLALVEYPLNAVVFDVLGQSPFVTAVLALIPVAVLVLTAHYTGAYVRRSVPVRSEATRRAMLVTICGLMVAVITVFSVLREEAIKSASETHTALARLRSEESGGGSAPIPSQKDLVDPRVATMAFALLNGVMFLGATLVSIHVHHEQSEEDHKNAEQVKRVLSDVGSRESKLGAALEAAKREEQTAETAYADIEARRRSIFQQNREEALIWKNQGEALIREYRMINARVRTDGKDNYPEVAFDLSSLDKLDETCEDSPTEGGDVESEAAEAAPVVSNASG